MTMIGFNVSLVVEQLYIQPPLCVCPMYLVCLICYILVCLVYYVTQNDLATDLQNSNLSITVILKKTSVLCALV